MYIFLKSQGKIVGAIDKDELRNVLFQDGICTIWKGVPGQEFSIPMTPDEFNELLEQLREINADY